MYRPLALALLGLLMVLGYSSQLYAQQVQPISYEELLSRVEALESDAATRYEAAALHDGGCGSGQPCCGASCRCNPCAVRGGFFASYESVLLQPYFSHNEAFQIFDSARPPPAEDVQIIEFDWDFEYTPRIEVGYIIPCSGLGWRARYWHFDNNTSLRANDPGAGFSPRIEVGLHDDPDIEILTADDEFVRATHSLKLDVVDLEMMFRRELPCCEVTVSGGLRYLRMNQNYRAEFTNINTGVIDDIVTSNHTFEGIGPTFALEGVRRLGMPCWSLFSKLRGSVVFGDSSLQQAQIVPQFAAPVQDFLTASNSMDVLFIGEVQLGVRYERCLSGCMLLFATLAVEAQYWPSGGSGAYQNGEDSDGIGHDPRDADMGFFGVSAAAGVNW